MRAKFTLESIEFNKTGAIIKMHPVISGSKENEMFYKYTPGGTLVLATVNTDIAKKMKVGCEYYLDITEASPVV